MVHRDVLDAYIQSYREYAQREADKSRELKSISELKKRSATSADQTHTPNTPTENSTGLSWKFGLARIIDSIRTIFRNDQPCETC